LEAPPAQPKIAPQRALPTASAGAAAAEAVAAAAEVEAAEVEAVAAAAEVEAAEVEAAAVEAEAVEAAAVEAAARQGRAAKLTWAAGVVASGCGTGCGTVAARLVGSCRCGCVHARAAAWPPMRACSRSFEGCTRAPLALRTTTRSSYAPHYVSSSE
jgi:hypothetical protein